MSASKKLSGEITDREEIEEELPLEGIPFVNDDAKKPVFQTPQLGKSELKP